MNNGMSTSTSVSCTIRAATVEDTPVILSFIKHLAAHVGHVEDVVATEEMLREELFGEKPKAEVLICFHEDVPVGTALFFHTFSTFLGKPGIYLEDLVVLEEYRGKGFGKALLAELARITKERGCARLEWSVLRWNTSAIAFYESLRAEQIDDFILNRVTGEALDALAAKAR